MSEQNKTVVRRLYEEVFEGGRLAAADELVHPEARDHADAEDRRGPERVKAVAQMLKAAFPDAHWDIRELLAEGDRVAMHAVWSGTQSGPFMGMPATGNRFENVHHIYLFSVRDGQVTDYRAVRDDMAMMRQLQPAR